MVHSKIATGAGILLALMLTAGLATAQGPLALVTGEGGGQAQGQAESGYHADASGAVDAVAGQHGDVQDQVVSTWESANGAYESTEAAARAASQVQMPAQPDCACGEQVLGQLEQASQMEAQHADQIEKAAGLETEYVDAGADLSATGQVQAFFKDAFSGLQDSYRSIKDALTFDTQSASDVTGSAEATFEADDELRGQVGSLLAEEHELPRPNPKLSGDLGVDSVSQITSEAVSSGSASAGSP